MTGPLLRSGTLTDFHPLGAVGSPVYLAAAQLRSAIARRLGLDLADTLAIPQRNEDGDTLDWYAPRAGLVVPWSAASPEERVQAQHQLIENRSRVNELANTMQRESDTERQVFGRLLSHVTNFPDEEHVYLVDGRPVVTFWGFTRAGQPAGTDTLLNLDLLAAVPASAPRPASRRRWIWLFALALLLVAGLVATLFGLRTCQFPRLLPSDPASSSPADATATSPTEPVTPLVEESRQTADQATPESLGAGGQDGAASSLEHRSIDSVSSLSATRDRLIDTGGRVIERTVSASSTTLDADITRDGHATRTVLEGTDSGPVDGDSRLGILEGSAPLPEAGASPTATDESAETIATGPMPDDPLAAAGAKLDTGAEKIPEPAEQDAVTDGQAKGSPAEAVGSGPNARPEDQPQGAAPDRAGPKDPAADTAAVDPAADSLSSTTVGKPAGASAAGDTQGSGGGSAPMGTSVPARWLRSGWRTATSLQDPKTGLPIQMQYTTRDGAGRMQLRRHDGSICESGASASIQGRRLVIDTSGNILCADGTNFGRPTIECEPVPDGKARCRGRYPGGESFAIDMQQTGQ